MEQKMIKYLVLVFLTLSALEAEMPVSSKIDVLDRYRYITPFHDEKRIPHDTRLIIIAFDKKNGQEINNFLKTKDKYYLGLHKSVYISSINKMPKFFTRAFVIPKLQKYKHAIYLQLEKSFNDLVPNKKGQITVIDVSDRQVEKVSFISSTKELESIIEQ